MADAPKHIGVIMDGNRRFAKRLMLQPWKGHEWGKKKVEKLMDWCEELGIHELSLYTFSVQNFNRPKEEFEHIMRIFREAAEELLNDKRLEEKGIRIVFAGRIEMFPSEIQKIMKKVMEKTRTHKNYKVNFCMAYGGREEILDAVKRIYKDIQSNKLSIDSLDESKFSQYLYVQSEPELIIRTSGEHRTSGFLPWQSVYSELIFLEKNWPEFTKEDLMRCIEEYTARERRFGK